MSGAEYSVVYLSLSVLFFLVAFVFYVLAFREAHPQAGRYGFLFMRLGFIVATVFFGFEALRYGLAFPVINLSHALAFYAWSLAFVYLVLFAKVHDEGFGLFLAPILTLLTLGSMCPLGGKTFELQVTPLFAAHIATAYFAYASFTIGLIAALLYIIQHLELKKRNPGAFYHKLPSLNALDKLIYFPNIWGVGLMAVAVLAGLIWSRLSDAKILFYDSKTLVIFVSMAFYAVLLILRRSLVFRKSRLALINILIFIFMISGSYLARFIGSTHTFGS